MRNFILGRLAVLFLVLLVISLVVFVVAHMLPGDPVALATGPTATADVRAEVRKAWGLDQPLAIQYIRYLEKLSRGDLGVSLRTRQPIRKDLALYLPATLELATAAFLLGSPLALIGGVWAAENRDTPIDISIRFLASMGVALPVFWFGILLILVFNSWLKWLPSVGRLGIDQPIPPALTGMYIVDSAVAGQWATCADALTHILLPAICLAVSVFTPSLQVVRSAVLVARSAEHVRMARAKGLNAHMVLWKHVLRNAASPILTSLGLTYGLLLAGAIMTETVFSWPGIGFYVSRSILSLDYQPIQSISLFSAMLLAIVNLVIEIANAHLDPRIGSGG